MGAVATSLAGGRSQQLAPTPEQLRLLQTREYDTPRDVAFAATMTAFLDLGYRIQEADIGSGLIVASAASVDRLHLDFSGLATARQTPVASAFVEQRGDGRSRVRINLSVTTASNSSGAAGETAVWQELPYLTFFQRLGLEISDRQEAMPERQEDVPQPPAAPPQPRIEKPISPTDDNENPSTPLVDNAVDVPSALSSSARPDPKRDALFPIVS